MPYLWGDSEICNFMLIRKNEGFRSILTLTSWLSPKVLLTPDKKMDWDRASDPFVFYRLQNPSTDNASEPYPHTSQNQSYVSIYVKYLLTYCIPLLNFKTFLVWCYGHVWFLCFTHVYLSFFYFSHFRKLVNSKLVNSK